MNTEWDIFCENVRHLINKHALTNRQMARIMHIRVETLLRILNHEMPQRIGSMVILHLAAHFKCKPKDLFLPME